MCLVCFIISIISSISLCTTFHDTFSESIIRNFIHPSHGIRPRVIRISLRISLSLLLYYNWYIVLYPTNQFLAPLPGKVEVNFWIIVLKNHVLLSLPLFCIYYINIEKSKTLFLKCLQKYQKNNKVIASTRPKGGAL